MISDKSAGESFNNKFVSISFSKTKGRPCLDTTPYGTVAKVALYLKRYEKASLQ